MQNNLWEDEQAWTDRRYSAEYVRYLRATLMPPATDRPDPAEAREALWRTPIVQTILAHQAADGSWPLGGPPWFRIGPIPLLVLLTYGMRDQTTVRRGIAFVLSTIDRERFVWPRHETHDPREYYIAHQGRCLQVMAEGELGDDPRVQAVARNLLAHQRWDGGWSTKPAWMYRPEERRAAPELSCWICTLEVMRGLGRVLALPGEAIDRTLRFWQAHLSPQQVGLMLACLEFSANQGRRVGNSHIAMLLHQLTAARGPDGRLPKPSDYYEVLASHLHWRVTHTTTAG